MALKLDVITIFPKMVEAGLAEGVVGRARTAGLLDIVVHNLRDFTTDKHHVVDDVPFGGGPGMVMKPEPVIEAVEAIRRENKGPVMITEPWGEPFDQKLAAELARLPGLIIVCGRYEGIDDRVRTALGAREVSIGDYVLSGGEIAAMVIIDAVARLVPGVVGDPGSLAQDSFSDDLTGWPQFTRPAEFRGMTVPEVLLSGDHARIRQWRRQQAAQRRVSQTKEVKQT